VIVLEWQTGSTYADSFKSKCCGGCCLCQYKHRHHMYLNTNVMNSIVTVFDRSFSVGFGLALGDGFSFGCPSPVG